MTPEERAVKIAEHAKKHWDGDNLYEAVRTLAVFHLYAAVEAALADYEKKFGPADY